MLNANLHQITNKAHNACTKCSLRKLEEPQVVIATDELILHCFGLGEVLNFASSE